MSNKLLQRRAKARTDCVSLESRKYSNELEKLIIVIDQGGDLYKYQREFIEKIKTLHKLEGMHNEAQA